MKFWTLRGRRIEGSPAGAHRPEPAPRPEHTVEFADWQASFLALMDEAASTAQCDTRPSVAAVGAKLAILRPQVEEIHRISGGGLSCWPTDPMFIGGVRLLFEAATGALATSLGTVNTVDATQDDERRILENSWNASTLDLINRLTHLRSMFIAEMERAGQHLGPEWLMSEDES